jgi:hypothetical protein
MESVRVQNRSDAAAGPVQTTCTTTAAMGAASSSVVAGEPVAVTVTAATSCLGEGPLRIVLVLDDTRNANIDGATTRVALQALDALNLDERTSTQVAVVGFAAEARRVCDFTDSRELALQCVAAVGHAGGGSRVDLGITEAASMLLEARSPDGLKMKRVMVVVTPGDMTLLGCPSVIEAAANANGAGLLLMTDCESQTCDESCMREAASSPRYYFRGGQGLTEVILDLVQTNQPRPVRAVVTDTLPSTAAFVDAETPPTSRSHGTLMWRLSDAPALDAFTLTFRVRFTQAGTQPLADHASGVITSSLGTVHPFTVSAPSIEVLPWPTATPSPTAEPSPRPREERLFMPVAFS